MITMRVGNQGIPLWFRCFEGKNNTDAFDEELLKQGIKYVSDLFDDSFDLIFLADRWFNSTTLLQYIEELDYTYVVRLKRNLKVKVNGSLNHKNVKTVGDIKAYVNKAKHFNNAILTDNEFKTNIAISKQKGVKEPWIIATNGDPKRAIKDYGYRFGGIEFVFKNQKSNGFRMESTVNASLKYFESMYTIACFTVLFLTIFGADYTKNTKCYKEIKLETHKKIKGIRKKLYHYLI